MSQREEDLALLREADLDEFVPAREGFWSLLFPWRAIARWIWLKAMERSSDEHLHRWADMVEEWIEEDEREDGGE